MYKWVAAKVDDRTLEIEHLDGVPWLDAPVPSRFHRCRPQTRGWLGFDRVYRCACGSISRDAKRWLERNSRRKH